MSMSTTKYKIQVVATHYPVASGRYIARAFRRMGHDVKTVGQCTGNKIWGMEVSPKHIWTPDAPLDCTFNDWKPDLIVIADSAFQYHNSVLEDVPHVVWGVDNHVRDYQQPGIAHYFMAHSEGPVMPVNGSDMTWLPCAYDPEYFTRIFMPYQRTNHVAMVGVVYKKRNEILTALDKKFRVEAGVGALYEDFADIYNNSLVSLCHSVAGDMAQRIFETAAMGCVILSDECDDFEKMGFEAGKHFLPFVTPQDAVDAMVMLLSSQDKEIMKLAENAYEWAKPHTWDARAQVVLDTMFGGAS